MSVTAPVTINDSPIQAMIDEAFRRGGGEVFVPRGTEQVYSSINMKSNVRLYGVGRGSVLNDAVGNMTLVGLSDCENFVVENLAFTGSGTLGVAGRAAVDGELGSYFGPRQGTLRGLFVENVGTCGISMANATEVDIEGCYVKGTKEHGIYLSLCTDCTLSGNRIRNAGGLGSGSQHGIKLADSLRISVCGGSIIAPEHEGIVFESGTTDCTVVGVTIRDCPQRSVRFNAGSARNTVMGCVFVNATTQSVRALGGANNRIIGNTFNPGASADWMIWIDVAATDTEVLFNNGVSAVAITDNGTRTVKFGNKTTNAHAAIQNAMVIATASLPAAAAEMDGTILIEDVAAGDRNLIVYAGGQRFRLDGGAAV